MNHSRGEDGMALVVALLVTLISFVLVTSVLAQAVHNIAQAGNLRRRLAAIHAAEAGLNWYTRYLSSANLVQLRSWPFDESSWRWRTPMSTEVSVSSFPDSSRFTLRVRYVIDNPCTVSPCAPSGSDALGTSPLPDPFYAIVQSIGCAGSSDADADIYTNGCKNGVARSLEAAIRLHPSAATSTVGAGLIGTSLCLTSSAGLQMVGGIRVVDPSGVTPPPLGTAPAGYGCPAGGISTSSTVTLEISDGDFYVDGASGLSLPSGSVLHTNGSIWAEGPVTLLESGPTPAACGSGKICVDGDVIGSLVSLGSGAYVGGQRLSCGSTCPLDLSFPRLVYDPGLWAGWLSAPAASGADALALAAAATEKTVIRISGNSPGVCDVEFPNSTQVVISTDVAIVSDCGFRIGMTDDISGTGSLILMSAWPGTLGSPQPAPTCGDYLSSGWRGVIMENNPSIGVPLSIYTPCVLYLQNNAPVPISGQFVAQFIWVNQDAKLASAETLGTNLVPVPGIIRGFSADVRYIREIPVP